MFSADTSRAFGQKKAFSSARLRNCDDFQKRETISSFLTTPHRLANVYHTTTTQNIKYSCLPLEGSHRSFHVTHLVGRDRGCANTKYRDVIGNWVRSAFPSAAVIKLRTSVKGLWRMLLICILTLHGPPVTNDPLQDTRTRPKLSKRYHERIEPDFFPHTVSKYSNTHNR